jgi:hypothetical protein
LTSGAFLPIALDQAGITFFGGKLYVVGDFVPTPQGRHPTSALLMYDPVLVRWDEGSPMPSLVQDYAQIVDGLMYAIGEV